MDIGIIDADLIGRKHHNFPNLALMKLSGYHKAFGHNVELISYQDIGPNALFRKNYDIIYISKVFSNTPIPDGIIDLPNVKYGGSGFMYKKGQKYPDFFLTPQLPDEIEHHFPDYHLYDEWIKNEIRFRGKSKSYYKNYTDFSIGFTTRGCFRKCSFCYNRDVKMVTPHSPISEFFDSTRNKICLLDDNIFGYRKCIDVFTELQKTGKPFYYNQGLDIRLLNERKLEVLAKSKYAADYTFAFDNYNEKEIITEKIKLFKQFMPKTVPKFYIFCAYDENNVYDEAFWVKDIVEIFERLKILLEYGCIPYIMKFEKWRKSPYQSLYSYISSWAAPIIFKKQTFYEYHKDKKSLLPFIQKYPDLAKEYFNMRYKINN